MMQINFSIEATADGLAEAIDALTKMRSGITGKVTPDLFEHTGAPVVVKGATSGRRAYSEEQETDSGEALKSPDTGDTGENEQDAPADVELDADGYPWDERIHASSKAKVAAGTWKLKRNIDPGFVKEVRDEYDAQGVTNDDDVEPSLADTPPPPPPAADTPPPPPPLEGHGGNAAIGKIPIESVPDFMKMVLDNKISMQDVAIKVKEYGFANLAEAAKTDGMLDVLAGDLCTA
jgi:hypothetical protein